MNCGTRLSGGRLKEIRLNILTKISIVVLVVLVLVACPVFIRLATVGPNYKAYADGLQAKLDAVTNQANLAQTALQTATAQLERQAVEKQTSSEQVAQQLGSMQAQLKEEQIRNAKLQSDLQTLNTNLTELRSTIGRESEQRIAAVEASEKLRDRVNQQVAEIQQLDSALKESQSSNADLQLALRSQEEKIGQLNELIEQQQQRLAGTPVTPSAQGAQAAAGAAPKVSGSVTAVENDAVAVNIGSAKGLREGAVLVVYRGDQFVSHLRIQQVDPNQAAGVVFDKKLQPMQGDKVSTAASVR